MSHTDQRKESDTLYLSNIPAKSCTIPELYRHFKEYGYIKSIWASGTTATITFKTVEEAVRAFNSPKAYANNRFVWYHYHNNPDKAESKLSHVVDKEYVSETVKEVLEAMEMTQRKTKEYQTSMKHNTMNELNTQKKDIESRIKSLEKEYDAAPPDKKEKILANINEYKKVLEDLEKL